MAAKTTAYQVNTICMPKNSLKMFPKKAFLPKRNNKPNPTAGGGKTIGNKNNASTTVFPKKFRLEKVQARKTPSKNTIIVATLAVFRDIHKGKRSISIRDYLQSHNV